jgi:hypothetical protein
MQEQISKEEKIFSTRDAVLDEGDDGTVDTQNIVNEKTKVTKIVVQFCIKIICK